MKNIRIFYLKIFIFLVVKFSVYLNRHVFVMGMLIGNNKKIIWLTFEQSPKIFTGVIFVGIRIWLGDSFTNTHF